MQFSLRSVLLLVLIAGPAAGALAGTFGMAIQELLLGMLAIAWMSVVLAAMAAGLAFVILSPLLVLEHRLRGSARSISPAEDRESGGDTPDAKSPDS